VAAATATTASAKGTPAVTATPNTGIGTGTAITVDATGFPAKTKLFVAECNSDSSAPTIGALGVPGTPQVSVGCSAFNQLGASKTTKAGAASGTLIALAPGQVGPPGNGNDSSGGSGQADAANFPCPANPANGTGCVAEVIDSADAMATAPITFTPVVTTSKPTTGCTPSGSKTVTEAAGVGSGKGTATVSPVNCVSAGTVLTITATNLLPNDLGSILECNGAANMPTVTFVGNPIPVGCSSITAHIFTSSSSGGENAKFTVLAGVVGPPATGTDSAGNSAAADAAHYPCPPTGSTNGEGCGIAVGTSKPAAGPAQGAAAQPAAATSGDQVVVPIAFSSKPGTSPGGGTGGGGGSTSPSGGSGASTAANSSTTGSGTSTSSSSLAFTGPGAGLWLIAGVGMVLIGFGCLVMAYGDVPRRLLIGATHRGAHTRH
jgi:hypothetical protein